MNQKLTIPVKGMHCASCAITIQKTLNKSKGVINCEVNYGNEKAKIEFDPAITTVEELSKSIEPLGYSLQSEHINHMMHQMHNGSLMVNHEMHEIGRIDHSAHLGSNQSKEDKIKELAEQQKKVEFVMPITVLIFALMLWEIASQTFRWVPLFFLPHKLFQILSLILSTVVLFWIGKDFLKEVVVFAKYRVANMYTLVGIGTLAAYLYSALLVLFPPVKESLNLPDMVYLDVVIVVIGFIYLGKFLESRSKLRTGEAIEKLLNLQSKTAIIERDGKELEISIDQVEVGDVIIVKPGGKIPLDGIIIEGKSTIDESMVTGESMPIDKELEDKVIGGTINKQGTFKFKATKVGSETLLAHIIKMVDEAQGSKAPIQGLADRISAVFVPVVLALAVITLLIWLIIGSQFMPFTEALSFGLLCFVGILVIACPCALGLATPTAIIVGTGKGAENGILIKNAESLEKLHKVNTIVTDKTGTLTKGEPEVTDILLLNDEFKNEDEMLEVLASLEKSSEHPIAKAILNKATLENIELLKVLDFEIIEGKGLKGKIDGVEYFAGNLKLIDDLKFTFEREQITKYTQQGKTPVLLTNSTEILAIVAVADTLKDGIKETVSELHNLGIKIVMLTGDNEKTAKYIAEQIGIDKVIAEVLPNEKAEKVKELQSQGNIVAMIGDGVNDAPALTQSDVGIAMGTGTDIAIESAELTLLQGDFSKVLQAIKLSKFTMRAIKQNLFWAFAYNIIGIPIAAGLLFPFFGILLNPIFAGLAMALSSVSVVSNSLRLKSVKI
jgi:Cu2+-exporting ATPase/Cu+-exporting ATPase